MMRDRSAGYDRIAAEFAASRNPDIGAATVVAWARALPPASTVLDLGCGTGIPITRALIAGRLSPYGVDASPRMVAAFRENLPGVPVACEPVESSSFFGRRFHAIVAWGLVFLLPPEFQGELIRRAAEALEPGGRFLFTAPETAGAWKDLLTGRPSASLGAAEYRRHLAAAGLTVVAEYEDEGDNHYYDSRKTPPAVNVPGSPAFPHASP